MSKGELVYDERFNTETSALVAEFSYWGDECYSHVYLFKTPEDEYFRDDLHVSKYEFDENGENLHEQKICGLDLKDALEFMTDMIASSLDGVTGFWFCEPADSLFLKAVEADKITSHENVCFLSEYMDKRETDPE